MSKPEKMSSPALAVSADANVKFNTDGSFQRTLKARVDAYFASTGQKPRDCIQMYVKSAIIMGWFAASYILLVCFAGNWWQAILSSISLSLSIAAVAFNIQHDGGHKAYSKRSWINRLMATSLDLLGGSSYIWDHKHNTVHHTYANITDHDDDIDLGFLARLSPHQKRLGIHRLQHLYLWILYGFLPIKWQLYDDFHDVIVGRVGTHSFARPRGKALAIFIAGKVASLSLAFVVPLFFHSIWAVLLFYVIVLHLNGVILAVVFQLAHVVEESSFPMPDTVSNKMDDPWAIHQVQTTVDFARNNPFLTWYLGGLNYQVEHHLFPRICHINYPRISKMVEEVCTEFGIRYNANKTMLSAICSHYRWLRTMGKPTAG